MQNEFENVLGKVVAGEYYDNQQIRQSEMNRIREILRRKNEGIALNAVQEKKEEKTYGKEYQDKNIGELLEEMKKSNKLSEQEYAYVNSIFEIYNKSKKEEAQYKKLMTWVEKEPIYEELLSKISGIGELLSANIILTFGTCKEAPHVSSLWKFCGLAPGQKRKKGERGGSQDLSLSERPGLS